MKKNKKVTLYSNEITEEKIESARQYLLEENGEEPTDSELWEYPGNQLRLYRNIR